MSYGYGYGAGYPQQQYAGYPQQGGYGYGAGYPQQQQQAGYPQQQQQQQQTQNGGVDQILGAIVPQLFGLLTSTLFGEPPNAKESKETSSDSSKSSKSSGKGDDATATENLQILADNKDDVELFDADDDGKLSRSELKKLASSNKSGVGDDVKSAAKWLASDDGKKAFEKLDTFGGKEKDNKFDAAALKHVAEDEDLDDESSDSIENGQDALNAINDQEFLKSISTKNSAGQDQISFEKLKEVAENKGDKYTEEQQEAAEFITKNDDLKAKLDGSDKNNIFLASDVSRLLNDDSSLSDID